MRISDELIYEGMIEEEPKPIQYIITILDLKEEEIAIANAQVALKPYKVKIKKLSTGKDLTK